MAAKQRVRLATLVLTFLPALATAETTVVEAARYLDVVSGQMVSPAVIVTFNRIF